MAISKRIKEQSELMEKRLKELKEAMVKEKEERRRFMETRWKSARLLKKTILQPELNENLNLKLKILKDESKKEDKTKKKPNRKQEKCYNNRVNKNNDSVQGLELKCAGSTLHSRCVPITPKQMVRGHPANFYSPRGQDLFENESTQSQISEDEEVTCISPVNETEPNQFDGVFDEVKNSREFQQALFAWRESKLEPIEEKKCADKETNPLVPCLKKFDQNDITRSYELALLNASDQSDKLAVINENKQEHDDFLFNVKEKSENVTETKICDPIVIGNDLNDFDDCKENTNFECIDFEASRLVAAATGMRKILRNQNNIELMSLDKKLMHQNSIQVCELETNPFESIIEGPVWILPEVSGEKIEMFGRFEDSKRLPSKPRVTVSPMFNNNLLDPLQPASRSIPSHFPRWSTAPAERDLLSRSSSSLNGALPLPQRIPLSRKYNHVQSKVAQLWQGQKSLTSRNWQSSNNLPSLVIDYDDKPNRMSNKRKENKNVKLSQVREEVVQLAIGLHVRRLSQFIPSQSADGEDDLLDENVKCEVFGIKDFLSVIGSDDDETAEDMGKALETKPPDVLDCHLVEIMTADTPPPLDDVRTPTPSSDIGADGFPDECMQSNFEVEDEKQQEQPENKKESATPGESERSDSELSLNSTNASVDSTTESEFVAAETLEEVDLNLSQIDNAVDTLLRKLSTSKIEEQLNAINGEEDLNNGDRFDDKATVASLK